MASLPFASTAEAGSFLLGLAGSGISSSEVSLMYEFESEVSDMEKDFLGNISGRSTRFGVGGGIIESASVIKSSSSTDEKLEMDCIDFSYISLANTLYTSVSKNFSVGMMTGIEYGQYKVLENEGKYFIGNFGPEFEFKLSKAGFFGDYEQKFGITVGVDLIGEENYPPINFKLSLITKLY